MDGIGGFYERVLKDIANGMFKQPPPPAPKPPNWTWIIVASVIAGLLIGLAAGSGLVAEVWSYLR